MAAINSKKFLKSLFECSEDCIPKMSGITRKIIFRLVKNRYTIENSIFTAKKKIKNDTKGQFVGLHWIHDIKS